MLSHPVQQQNTSRKRPRRPWSLVDVDVVVSVKLLSWADRLSLAELSVAFICSQVKVLPMHLPLAQEQR